jgi:WD40 repeat protein
VSWSEFDKTTTLIYDLSKAHWGRKTTIPSDDVTNLVFSPDGRKLVMCGADYRRNSSILQLWDIHTIVLLGELRKEWSQRIVSLAFSPEGTMFASGSSAGAIQLWDGATCTPIREVLLGNDDYVSSVSFSTDGRYLVSSSDSGEETHILCWTTDTYSSVEAKSMSIDAGILRLNMYTGWVEGVDGRKFWWMPAHNRGAKHEITRDGRMATIAATGRLSLIDGTNLVEAEKSRLRSLETGK